MSLPRILLRVVFTAFAGVRKFTIVRNKDILPLVSREIADVGFVGSDTAYEYCIRPESADLRFVAIGEAVGQYALATTAERLEEVAYKAERGKVITTTSSYPNALSRFALDKGLWIDCVFEPQGKVESYVENDVSDTVFDIVTTGNSMRSNQLKVIGLGGLILPGISFKDKVKRELRALRYNGDQE